MADGDSNLTTPAGTSSLVTKAVCSNLDWHDRWNLLAIGSLNVAHCAWWCSLLPEHLLGALFCADVGYICGDLAWIALVPGCVPPGARPTLLLHHVLTCCCAPVAMGRPVLMAHLLRAWIVELHSWNHIAARQLVRAPRLRRVLQARPCHLCTPCHHLPSRRHAPMTRSNPSDRATFRACPGDQQAALRRSPADRLPALLRRVRS